MLVIKPYGRSNVKKAAAGEKAENCWRAIRTVEKNSGQSKIVERPIAGFIAERDEAVIAQWVSIIDKIIAKPGEKDSNNKAQELRKILAAAAWAVIKSKNLLAKLAGTPAERQEIEKIWQWKMAATQPKEPRALEGRWYEAFAAGIPCDTQHIKADAAKIADRIYIHLYRQAYRFPLKSKTAQGSAAGDSRCHQKGLIQHRASAIAENILHIPAFLMCAADKEDYSDSDKEAYSEDDKKDYSAAAGNFAAEIKRAILVSEKLSRTDYKDRPYEIAARIMRETGDRLFACLGDKAQKPGLLALHSQIKSGYKALLKGRKQLKARLEYLLPQDNAALFQLVEAQQQNRYINHLIRLGKIVHYTAIVPDTASLAALQSSPKTIINNWPQKEAVEGSRFWSSAGQTEIKQNEAFVRVWRGALAFAARTVKDWVDPQDKIPGDILLNQTTALDNFDADYFEQKYQILFGNKWEAEEDKKALLEFSLSNLYALRNAAFHFSNLRLFVEALMPKKALEAEKLDKFLATFYTDACHNYQLKQKAIMQGAQFHDFFSEAEIETIWQALTSAQASPLPVPRLKRVLERAADAWKGWDNRLQVPPYSTAEEREASAWARCQYTAAKLLYDGPFKNWLEGLGQAALSGYINRALEHTSQAAKKIKNGDKEFEEFIISKAGKIAELGDENDFRDFFSTLTAATATEMRVQNFYQSDGKAAKKQADYIEKFKCDIVALAFADYVRKVIGLRNIAAFCNKERTEKPGSSRIYDRLPVSVKQNSTGAPWQSRLYFLLHLMPVEEAGSLRQQLKKWEIITDKSHGKGSRGGTVLTQLLAVFDLYIAMHDAQFVGAELASLESDKETAQALFENEGDFRQIFPEKKDGIEDEHLPIRGLREMQRFGTSLLHNFYEKHQISEASVARWQKLEKIIAQEQRKLKKLHQDWVNSKKRKNNIKWKEENAYEAALKLVTEHRHLTARVMLQSHVRLHRLLIKILGRLVDFAGLWERDLYFVLLAQLYCKGVEDIEEQFKDKGAKLGTGQIVAALRKLKDTGLQAKIASLLNQQETQEIRNGFDHFDTLKKKYFPVNLTAEVNKARRLMAYDRKLKNAVTKSVIDLLRRENIELKWSMGADHELEGVLSIFSAKACHLAKEYGNNKIAEELCDAHYVAMIESLLNGNS